MSSGLEASVPIFEYLCEGCGHKFEAILFGDQKPECPACHTSKLEQQLSTFAVSKGSGAAMPSAGCGQSNCCMMNGGGCGEPN
jgi:putative FmdB family regulatory protein